MVYRLRNKFIRIVMLSALAVFLTLFLILFIGTNQRINMSLDVTADLISQNGGMFPKPGDKNANFDALPFAPTHMNPESSYSTRFFSVHFNKEDEIDFVDTAFVGSITKETAADYANKALAKEKERGWIGDYRYKVYESKLGRSVVFVNGADTKMTNRVFLLYAAAAFAGSLVVILILVTLLSKRAVRPVAESYEKQKQFITDANHELKTPLTIIRTGMELAESELGKNEWLDDIRDASDSMTALVEKLVALARMDEERTTLAALPFDLSAAVMDTAGAFRSITQARGFSFSIDAAPGVQYVGDEERIRQLISILLDNAVKYCDPGGSIRVALSAGKRPSLTVDNSFASVNKTDLNRLFDRFYRGEQARAYGSGSGIGLSVARAIVEKHRGQIEAQKLGDSAIRFSVRL